MLDGRRGDSHVLPCAIIVSTQVLTAVRRLHELYVMRCSSPRARVSFDVLRQRRGADRGGPDWVRLTALHVTAYSSHEDVLQLYTAHHTAHEPSLVKQHDKIKMF